jgi:hypothetical protein
MSFTTLTSTQNEFLQDYLRGTKREMTVAQARATFGIGNLRARVHELRKAGLNVQSRKNYRGAASYWIPSRDLFGSRAYTEV